MPSRVLTVILNSNHNKRFALLLPENDRADYNITELILREARNKFRVKSISTIFLRGGITFVNGANLLDSTESQLQVWVSKGEAYSGPPSAPLPSDSKGEVRTIDGKSYIDPAAVKQLHTVASLQGVRLAVGMPDLHPGSRFPIGCAIASHGIYPALIGSDIGCGIALYHLCPPSSSLHKPKKLAQMLQGLDAPWEGDVPAWLAQYDLNPPSDLGIDKFNTSLGSVGGGNHFAEICTVERIVDASVAEELNIQEGGLYLMVHTGSRGLGSSILATETSTSGESNPYIPPSSPHLYEYLAAHDYAVRWAEANRDLVALRIKRCLFPPSLQHNEPSIPRLKDLQKIVDVTHNSVTLHSVGAEDLWVHRKGAAPADNGIAPCPGSRGDFSWLLQPMGDGQVNAHSLAHGAGRRFARAALHNMKDTSKASKGSLTSTNLGSEVICTDRDLLIEERPEAYKNVNCVVEDMEEHGLCRGVVVLRPMVTYKVG